MSRVLNNSPAQEREMVRIAARAVQLYAETHPRPTQVSRAQAAEMLGVHPKIIRNYIIVGKLKLNDRRKIPIEAPIKSGPSIRAWA